jgi:signal peptidase II
VGGHAGGCRVLAGSDALTAPSLVARLRPYLVIVATAVIVFGLDHITKWLVVQHLPLYSEAGSNALITIHHVENRGAAFGLFPQFQWAYLLVAVVVVIYILVSGHRFGTTWYRQVLLGMILGGAVANGIDRATQGYVVDFIDVHWWPIFNVADMSIVIGILVALLTLRLPSRRRTAA